MPKIIGIDIGGTTTKIVGYDGVKIFSPMLVRATDPIASVYGAFGKFLSENSMTISDIDRVMVTGVGSSYIKGMLYGVPTDKVDEFMATGLGGLFLSGLPRAIVVSMGTGTALVIADKHDVKHIGGTGVGGGTLLGLSNKMLNIRDFDDLIETARNGDLGNVDLVIGDITRGEVKGLPPETTASNFGKISDLASREDIALGIINLVFQTIGMMAVFATRFNNTKDVVLTGNLINVPQAARIFGGLEKIFDVKFHMPRYAEYATATGAAIAHVHDEKAAEV